MSNILVESIVKYGSQFMAVYKRNSRATEETKEGSGYNASLEDGVIVGISAVEEYVVWRTSRIRGKESKTFSLNRWGADLNFQSVMVENPNADKFYIDVLDSGDNRITTQFINKNKTPLQFPPNPIGQDIKIKIRAVESISFIQLVAKPCKIIAEFMADEDYASISSEEGTRG